MQKSGDGLKGRTYDRYTVRGIGLIGSGLEKGGELIEAGLLLGGVVVGLALGMIVCGLWWISSGK